MTRLILCALACFAGAASAQTTVYKWTDSEGRVQYGAQPPAGVEAKPMTVNSKPASPVAKAEDTKPEETPEEAAARERAEMQKRNCETARSNLANYQQAGALMMKNPDGTTRALTMQDKQAGAAEAQAKVTEFCK